MRIPTTLALLALPLLAAAAAGQQDGCTQSSPCPLELTVDEGGFADQRDWNATVGDWYQVTAWNLDADMGHTITLEGHDVLFDLAPLQESSVLVRFDTAGDFFFVDMRADGQEDEAPLHVLELDVVAYEEGIDEGGLDTGAEPDGPAGPRTPADDEGAPGLGAVALLGGLAAAAAAVRRR